MIDQAPVTIRAFIAIELPAEVKSALKELQSTLSSASRAPVKWINPDNLHLTLNFLGNIREERIGSLVREMEEAADGIAPFTLELSGLGAFPNLNKVEVLWVGLAGDLKTLEALFGRLEDRLKLLGFPKEGRAFTPHLTLARTRPQATFLEKQALGLALGRQKFAGGQTIPVEAVNLMRSQLFRDGPTYSCLASVRLK